MDRLFTIGVVLAVLIVALAGTGVVHGFFGYTFALPLVLLVTALVIKQLGESPDSGEEADENARSARFAKWLARFANECGGYMIIFALALRAIAWHATATWELEESDAPGWMAIYTMGLVLLFNLCIHFLLWLREAVEKLFSRDRHIA